MALTKTQWSNLRPGTKVFHKTWKPIEGKPVDVVLEGVAVRFNSNHSQVLVKWNDDNFESWYGRLGLDLTKH